MPLLPTILADLPFGIPQRDYLGTLLPLLAGLPVRLTHPQPGPLRRVLSPTRTVTTRPAPGPRLQPTGNLRRSAPAQPSLQAYLGRFRPLFPRRDQAASFVAYAECVLSDERHKSVERMVLRRLGGDMNRVRRLQYFAADSAWSDQPFLERHWQTVGSLLVTREGVLLVDTTNRSKQGVHSVGVARQYCGRLDQVGNCQAGVFVAYSGKGGATRIHRRLFLTEAWTGDAAYAEHRRCCGVPGDSRGPEYADFALRRVVASRGSLPGPEVWLVLRRQPGADPVRVVLCQASRHIQPARLAHRTGARWAIETCFREGKQLLGLTTTRAVAGRAGIIT